jgi:hypothetical protein
MKPSPLMLMNGGIVLEMLGKYLGYREQAIYFSPKNDGLPYRKNG